MIDSPKPGAKTSLAISAVTLAIVGMAQPASAQAVKASAGATQAPSTGTQTTPSDQKTAPVSGGATETSGSAPTEAVPAARTEALASEPAASPASATGEAATGNGGVTPIGAATEVQLGATPSANATVSAPSAPSVKSFHERTPLAASFGEGERKLTLTLYGFVQADAMYDTTRSYGDAMADGLVARSDTHAGKEGRTQFSARNTRIGLMLQSAPLGGLRPSAVLEADFFGNQPNAPHPHTSAYEEPSVPPATEGAYFNNPALRLRHAYLKLQSDYVDVLAGQTYDVFGWQNYFFPCSVQYLGLPNMTFSRSTQFRLSHAFGAAGPVGVEVAAAALKPGQRDSGVPDANAGLRFSINGWKGITTPGNVGTTALPLSIGISGIFRQFKPNAFTPPPIQASNSVQGWGLSLDALIPVIPAEDAYDRGNKLTLTGSFVTGTGIGDLINATGGAAFPTLPNPTQANPAPTYVSNIDPGIVSFGSDGKAYTIDWQAFRVGLQYYLPPTGRLIFAANFTQAYSRNMDNLFPKGGSEIELMVRIANLSRYADANLFWDVTPAVRLGISGQYTAVEYLDGDKPHNLRGMAQALYVF